MAEEKGAFSSSGREVEGWAGGRCHPLFRRSCGVVRRDV